MSERMTDKDIEKGIKHIVDCLLADDEYDDFWHYNYVLKDRDSIMEEFFKKYFEATEGRACCADKSRHVVAKINQALKGKEHLSLQETYDIEKHPQMKGSETEMAYWCPENLTSTKEALDLFIGYISINRKAVVKFIGNEEKL